jgi:hypothetical protein
MYGLLQVWQQLLGDALVAKTMLGPERAVEVKSGSPLDA